MKKIFILAALTAMTSAAFAQVSVIPKAGITIANASLADDNFLEDGKSSLMGFTAGLGFNFPVTEDNFFSIQPEFLYSQKGFSSAANGIVNYNGDYRLNYIEVPLLAKINFGGEAVKLYVNAGPSVGYLLGGRVKGSGNLLGIAGTSINEPLEFTDSPNPFSFNQLDANRVDIGLNFGGGLGYSLGGPVIFADVRYNMGLTDYNRDSKSKNQVFAITAGLQIPLGGQ
jgi:hypothetical protein